MGATDGQDSAALSADVAALGALAAADQPDAVSLAGGVDLAGVLAGSELPDIAAISVAVGQPQSRLVIVPGVWPPQSATVKGAYCKTVTTPGLFGIRKAS
jgi:hypothetical protein